MLKKNLSFNQPLLSKYINFHKNHRLLSCKFVPVACQVADSAGNSGSNKFTFGFGKLERQRISILQDSAGKQRKQ